MKAMVCRAWGPPDVLRLENVPPRALGSGFSRCCATAAAMRRRSCSTPRLWCRLQSGETLLVLGAAGGVGLTAVEIGKTLGARVIAAAGGADKLAVAKSHGADELIDYRSESIRDRVRELTGGKGADVVYDPVGGDAFEQALRAVNWEARMLVIGFASGRVQAVPANLILVKNISVIGVVWGAQAERDPAWMSRNLAELLRWWCQGNLKPLVAETFPLTEAGAALNGLLSRRYAGKVVLET
jgi:NADPH2:quinone reductase